MEIIPVDQASHHRGPFNVIDLRESWNVNFWCDELNLRAEELKEIVKLVGPAVQDVREHLTRRLLLSSSAAY
jgi:hypothetical protein